MLKVHEYEQCLEQAPKVGLFAFECAYPTVPRLGQIALIESDGRSKLLYYDDGRFVMAIHELIYTGFNNKRGAYKTSKPQQAREGYELVFIGEQQELIYSRPVRAIHVPHGKAHRLSA